MPAIIVKNRHQGRKSGRNSRNLKIPAQIVTKSRQSTPIIMEKTLLIIVTRYTTVQVRKMHQGGSS